MPKKGGEKVAYRDIRTKPGEEKFKVYEEIDSLYRQGNEVKVKEHESGFPAITIDCGDIHILTDCLSAEAWYRTMRKSS